jgi:hypothetical protein
MNDIENAYSDLIARIEQIPFADGAEFLYGAFRTLSKSDFLIPGKHFLSVFEMAAIAKWIYLNAHSRKPRPVDWASVINAYKTLWREVENQTVYPDNPEVIASFILRFVYQQLIWKITQSKMQGNFQRTLGVFGGKSSSARELHRMFEDASGLPLEEFMKIAHAMYGIFSNQERVPAHIFADTLLQYFTPAHISNAERILVATRGQFRKYYESHASALLSGIPYELNPLLRYPIMLRDDHYWCVYPELINYASTRGLYFYIADKVGGVFNQAFSCAFEDYVYKLFLDLSMAENILTEDDERRAGWKGKTNDLTIFLGDSAILFECKNSCLFSISKRSASPSDLVTDIRRNLANAKEKVGLFQLHLKLEAIRNGRLPEPLKTRYASVKKFYPVILLHDEIWFANRAETLKNLIDNELRTNSVDVFEYQIWHVEELEHLLKTVPQSELLRTIEDKFSSPECRSLDLSVYLSHKFGLKHLGLNLFVPTGDSKAWAILRKLADADNRCID